ncbi:YadA-like family protein [Histophilus somni]|uniref:YadA-like family protein n=1 Tax=Histophilus somni TaxID=731 RepID=UPI0038783154
MNKIFKTKYDITTGQCKAVSELASNRQIASSSESQLKCGGVLRTFKVLPLVLVIAGFFGVSTISNAAWLAIDSSKGTVGIAGWQNEYGENNNKNNIVLGKEGLHRVNGQITKLEKVVVIGAGDKTKATGEGLVAVGYGAQALRDGATAVGYESIVAGTNGTALGAESKAQGAQATAIGNNVYAVAQGTALGADVMAAAGASIAIGGDDIFENGNKVNYGEPNLKAGEGGFADRLPETTIKQIYGYSGNRASSNKVTYSDILDWSDFSKKYVRTDDGKDHRMYSPTYAAGVGAIAIGSRSVGYGNASLAMGTLSFALADRSTAVGVRAFVGLGADGATAIGDSSRVFAKNSYAIGNAAESTTEGSLSFGSGAKAAGRGSIAIGPNVSSNAELTSMSAEKFRAQIMQETNLGNVTENQDPRLKTVTTDINDLKVGDHNEIVKYGFPANHFNGQNKISDLITKLEKENKFTYEKESKVEITTTEDIKKTKKQGDHAISLGYHISNNGDNTIAIGSASYVRGANSVVLGALNNVGQYATNTIAIGIGTNVHKENSVAIGTGTTILGAGSIGIGSGVGVKKDNSIAIGYGSSAFSEASMALGNDSKINENAKNSVALGNNSSTSFENSVALGYRSTTNYFYTGSDKTTASLSGQNASSLEGYVPEGSSYRIETDTSAGVISVGGWDTTKDAKGGSVSGSSKGNKNHVGLRRIVNVAPGALDSDAATVGQLRALYYVKKEGLVVYYTEEGGKKVKLVKSADDKKFYKVDTRTGEPLKGTQAIPEDKVLVGAKGFDEKIGDKDLGNKIQFGNLKDGKIAQNSDQAITGNQLKNVGDILGVSVNADGLKFDSPSFTGVEYIDTPPHTAGVRKNFKEALTDTINAINKGYKFSDGTNTNAGTSKYYLGSTLEIKAGDIAQTHKGANLKVKLDNTSSNSKATFTIGLKEDPSFKSVTITDDPKNKNHAVNKKYVDDKFSTVVTSFTVTGNTGSFTATNKLDIKGEGNISTKAQGHQVTISLKDTLTGISSITGKNGNSGNKIDFTNRDGLKLSSKSGSTITLKRDGLDLGNKKITQLAKGTADTDAANFGQLKDLATTVLGATVNSSGFTKSTFNQLIGSNGATASTPAIQKTFKQAIEDNIAKINKGFIFSDGTTEGTRYFGEKITIQSGVIDGGDFASDNIKTNYGKDQGVFRIGIKKDPRFEKVTVTENVTDKSPEMTLTTKKYVDDQFKNFSSDLKFETDSGGEKKISLKDGKLKVKGTANQIKTSVESNDTIKIGLDEKITKKIEDTATKADKNEQYIATIKTSIEGKITDQVIKYKANDTGNNTVKLSEGLNFKNGTNTTAVVESNGVVKFNVNEALKEIASIAGKEVNGGSGGTKVKTEIKFNENGAGNNKNTNVVILSNGAKYTFDPKGFHVGNKQITALASGLGLTDTSGSGGSAGNNSTVIANVLAGDPDKGNNNGNKISNNAINVKDLSEVAKALVEKGLKFQGNNSQDVTRKLGETLKIVGKGDKANSITVADNNINVSKNSSDDGLEIGLSDTLIGIKSVANGDKAKISLGGSNGSNNKITFKAGSSEVTLADGKFSGVSEINKADGKGALKLEDGKATLESTKDGSSIVVDNAGATIKVGTNKASYTFSDSGLDLNSKKLTNLASGLGLNGAGGSSGNGNAGIIEKVLSGNPDGATSGGNSGTSIANNAVNVKDLSEVAKAIVTKGLTFAGNTGGDVKASLGDKITIKGDGTYLTSEAKNGTGNSKEIVFSLTDSTKNKVDIINVGTTNNGDNSFALGKNSKLETKKTAPTGATISGKDSDVAFDWKNAGASADKMDTGKKEVVSVGDTGKERIITHVAAGEVRDGSTDAVNGGQLYSVAQVFSELGIHVLGAEKNDDGKFGFKQSKFEALKSGNGASGTATQTAMTFKQAIDKNIAKINEGLKFKGDNGGDKQLYLGSTLTIKGATGDASSPPTSAGSGLTSTGTDTHQNIFTTAKDTGILEIALNKDLKGITSIGKDTDNVLTFANGASGTSGGNSAVLKVGGSELTFTKADGDKVKITGLADGKNDGDAVTVKQLTASQLHYLSVKNGTSNTSTGTRTDNYNNDGAKGDKSIAIGVNTKTDMGAIGAVALGSGAEVKSEYGVAIGHGTVVGTGAKNSIAISAAKNGDKGKLEHAEWAISIGNKNNVSGGNDIVALGSNITISKNNGKGNDSVIAIGNGVELKNALQSIGVGKHTKVTNSEWSVAIGNNTKITNGNDIVALGSNITVSGSGNDSVLVFGNGAKASGAENSVVIGRGSESKAQSAVVVGHGATVQASAAGAVAVGEGATVETAAEDSIALGKGSKAKEKQIAPTGITQTTGQGQVKITWTGAGTSSSGAKDKTVVSVGDKGSERIITNVAAGKVETGSTDAINGGQLAEVISVFGKLGFDVLGAEKADSADGFKQSKFTAVQYTRTPQGTQQGTQQGQPTAPTTFREAINESITAINKGLMFSADQSAVANGTQNTPHYLGSTINIVRLASNTAGATSTPAPAGTSSQPNIAEFKGDNLITQYTRETNGNAKIEIGFKNAPMFEKVTVSQEQTYDGGSGTGGNAVDKNELITKGYLEQALNKFKFKVENGSGKPIEIGRGDTLKFTNGQNIQVTVKDGNDSATQASAGTNSASAVASAPAPTPAAPAPSPAPAAAPSSASASSTTTATTKPTTSTTTTGTPTAPTTAVVTIATKDELENIKSISSPKGSAGGNSGANSTGEITKLTLDADKGATFQVGNQGAKVNINKEGIALTPQEANNAGAGGASGTDSSPTIAIKVGSTASGSSTSNNGPAIEFAKNGTNGKQQGTGKITGLKDLEANSDGTSAVNKNYVDKLDKVTVKYDDEHKKSITLGGKPQNGGKAHDPVAIKNLKSALGIDNDSMKGKSESEKQGKSLDLVKKLVSNGISSQQGQKMTEQQDLHQAANLADLKAVAQAGLSFAGNESGKDKTVHRKLSDTLIIKGEENATTGSSATDKFNSTTTAAGNIKVEANTAKNGLEIKLSDTLKNMKAFETKEEGGKKATLNSEGLKVVNNKNGNGKDISATYGADNIMLEDKGKNNKATITAESLTFADNVAQNQQNPMPKTVLNKNGLTVTGKGGEIKIDGENGIITVPDIKPTTSGSAVVNKNYVDGKNNELRTQINTASRESRAGIAGALAAAGLPMSSVPGKSMFAASAGTFKGQNALALGYSRVSDNGKITLRLQGTRSSTGDVGGSVGVGYQW